MSTTTLYGSPLSLYTGRARSYLIKAGLPYVETTPTTDHYHNEVIRKAGGRQGVPTIELADGTVIRDGAAIIDHFEAASDNTFTPSSPKQQIISLLFDVIGAEGLLRPAMHYRWNFPEENLKFLTFHFESMRPAGPDRKAQAAAAADRMRGACQAFGVQPNTMALVEELYIELLQKLDQHFAEHPYLLGNKPSIGDFGMIAPLYGHLGRDPRPLALMQAEAIRLFRWVERMNRPEPDIGEFEEQSATFLADDQIPQTLINVLKQVAIDFVPETKAAAATINQWLSEQSELAVGTALERGLGFASFDIRGTTISALAQPYRFFLLKRVQDEFTQLAAAPQQEVKTLLSACGMSELLDIKLTRDIGRNNNLEVWL